MKMIKPIVNISKVIENYDVVLTGYFGVMTNENGIKPEAVSALQNIKKAGKKIILLTNSSLRVEALLRQLHKNNVPLNIFDAVITAGEILHYELKARSGAYASLGTAYYKLGDLSATSVFSQLDYNPVDDLAKADFLYMGGVALAEDRLENYLPELEYAASLGIPLLCVGNDTSTYLNGKVTIAPGAVAEQYAVMGGRILTIGKPDTKIIEYALDGIEGLNKNRVLLIGDNLATDIKGANLAGIHGALVSKGVHINFLGEGYIPDVAKTRELSTNFDSYPDFVISNLRW